MLYLFLAFFTGIILVVQMHMNSHLSSRLDTYNGVFYNYFTAVFLFLLYFIFRPRLLTVGISLMPSASIWMYTGGILGIMIVILCNLAFQKLSATYSTSLIILGQLGAAVVIDRTFFGMIIQPKEVAGMLLIACGIAYNSFISSRQRRTA